MTKEKRLRGRAIRKKRKLFKGTVTFRVNPGTVFFLHRSEELEVAMWKTKKAIGDFSKACKDFVINTKGEPWAPKKN